MRGKRLIQTLNRSDLPHYTAHYKPHRKHTRFMATVLLVALVAGCHGRSSTDDDFAAKDSASNSIPEITDISVDAPEVVTDIPPEEPVSVTDWSLLTPQAGDITDLILVTGQSNVRGANTSIDAALDSPNKQAFSFNFDGQWRVSDLHQAWDGNWAPGNGFLQDDTRQPNNNFVFHFGKVVAERDSSRVIGYVVVSAPGKGISHWDRDRDFFYKVRDTAIDALNAQGVKSAFDAVLWHQGETDWQSHGTSDPIITGEQRNEPNYYHDKLTALIADFRNQSWVNDDAYFICGETAVAPVNEVLMSLNSDNDPRTGCVSADNLTTLDTDPVPVHFDAAGLRELGKRYAEMYLQMSE